MPSRIVDTERLAEVARLLSLQVAPSEVVRRISEKWSVTDRTVRKDVLRVYAKWEEESKGTRAARRYQLRRSLELVFQRAMAKDDFRAAVMACDRLARLEGLNEPVAVEHSGAVGVASVERVRSMTTAERRQRILELATKHGLLDARRCH